MRYHNSLTSNIECDHGVSSNSCDGGDEDGNEDGNEDSMASRSDAKGILRVVTDFFLCTAGFDGGNKDMVALQGIV